MKISIVDGCIGCGLCAESCPEVFQMGDDGLAHIEGDPNPHSDAARDAAVGCPVNVIIVEE